MLSENLQATDISTCVTHLTRTSYFIVNNVNTRCWERPTGWQWIGCSSLLPAPVYIASYLIFFVFLYLEEYKILDFFYWHLEYKNLDNKTLIKAGPLIII
jgi:hypothetical protein